MRCDNMGQCLPRSVRVDCSTAPYPFEMLRPLFETQVAIKSPMPEEGVATRRQDGLPLDQIKAVKLTIDRQVLANRDPGFSK